MKSPILQRLKLAGQVLFRSSPMANFDWVPRLGDVTDRDLTSPYAQSVWVMRAIKKIAAPIAAVPLKFMLNEEEHEDPKLTAFWNAPARGLQRFDFVEASVGWLKLAGETFWLMDDNSLRPFPEVGMFPPLVLARPDRLREVIEDGVLFGWEYRTPDSKSHTLLADQVVQSKFWNPYNEWRGLAEYAAALTAAEADYAAGRYAKNLMANNGDTGPIIASKGGMINEDQQRQIISQLRMKQEYARRGDFRAVFLTSDVTVENPTAQTTDANYAAMRLQNRHEIFLAFGVPPSMADVQASYSIGSASDWFMLITETCIPMAEKLANAISKVAQKQTGLPLEAYFDFDEHPVLQTVRRERIDTTQKLWAMGMPLERINDYLDLGLEEFEGWGIGYLPFSVAPVGEAMDLGEDPAFGEEQEQEQEQEDGAVGEAMQALRTRIAKPVQCGCCSLNLSDLAFRANDSKSVRRWKSIVAKRRETIRAYESRFNSLLMLARAEVLGKLATAAAQRSPVTRAVAADFMFNLDKFSKLFQAGMRNVAATALDTAGQQLYNEINKDDPWKTPAPKALEFFANRENRLAKVPDAIFERIKGRIEDGLKEGAPLRDIAKAVRGEFNEISKKRANVIAQTETAAAYGTGRQAAMETAGIQWKQWLVSGNSNIRPAHKLMADVIVGINEPFIVFDPKTGETDEVKFPGDPTGQPWNVINCHCVEIAVAAGPEGEVEPSV